MKRPPPHSQDRAPFAATASPGLGVLVLVAGLAWFFLNPAVVGIFQDVPDLEDLLRLKRWQDLFRNLVAVAGVWTLAVSVYALVVSPFVTSVARRFFLALFGIMFVVPLSLSTFLTENALSLGATTSLTWTGAVAGHALAVLAGVAGVRHTRHFVSKLLLFTIVGAVVFSFAGLTLSAARQVGERVPWISAVGLTTVSGAGLRRLSEGGYLLSVPVLLTLALRFGRGPLWARFIAVVVLGAALSGLSFWLLAETKPAMSTLAALLYGRLHLSVLMARAPWLYFVALPMGWASSWVLIASDHPFRQVGVGAQLFLLAGVGPTSLVPTLLMALGSVLIAHATACRAKLPLGGHRASE